MQKEKDSKCWVNVAALVVYAILLYVVDCKIKMYFSEQILRDGVNTWIKLYFVCWQEKKLNWVNYNTNKFTSPWTYNKHVSFLKKNTNRVVKCKSIKIKFLMFLNKGWT